jgi:hypothetical protein
MSASRSPAWPAGRAGRSRGHPRSASRPMIANFGYSFRICSFQAFRQAPNGTRPLTGTSSTSPWPVKPAARVAPRSRRHWASAAPRCTGRSRTPSRLGRELAPHGPQKFEEFDGAYFVRSRAPVAMEIGPVLALEDVVGGKVCALASRVEPRDYADVARMLDRYSPADLIGFAGPPRSRPDRTRLR